MNYKYDRLTKEEKEKAKKDFYNTDRGKNLKIRFNRILVYGIILLLFGIILLIEELIKGNSISQIIYGIILILFGVAFIIGRFIVIRKQVNDFITKKKK